MVNSDIGMKFKSITANVKSLLGKEIKKYGLSEGQLDYFLKIADQPGITQRELAESRNVGRASVTKAIKILESDGFVERIVDNSDRRNFQCFVTEKGRKNVLDLLTLKKDVQGRLLDGLRDDEKENLYRYLTLMYENSEKMINTRSEFDGN